ncbi:hypothetical protein CSC67_10535 [Pusillimonas caeni]|uniref:hypothetical protein n=1 Tax=Pusillimonas caeni TaxID=1348472 RepID=UPI000E59B465|nr:hypothetical protein [Pusillimonas caeni]TFL13688.1 hypothetical protein CSC67_10535 [Pusillimonas caeni]
MRDVYALMAAIGLFSLSAHAQQYPASCWMLHDLSGVGYFQDDGYSPQIDKFSKPLRLILNGDGTTVGEDSLAMMQLDEFMAVGMGKTDTFTTVETYQVDPTLGVALYTKAIYGKSEFSNMTGARTFTGRAVRCQAK